MADEHVASTVVPDDAPAHEADNNILASDTAMVILTWVTFIGLLLVLQKFAWKPILRGLEQREKDIRAAIENADRAKAELTQIQQTRDQILNEAQRQAKEIVDQSRKAAVDAANAIRQKAKEEGQIMVQNALREITEASDEARSTLRTEGAKIAVQLAGKLIKENLNDERNLKLVDDYIKEM